MTNSITFIRSLADIIKNEIDIFTISDFDLSSIDGNKTEALVLHIENTTEALSANNTQRLSIIASLVLAPGTVTAEEESEIQTSVYDKLNGFLSDESLKYTEIGGAVFLQYFPGQYSVSTDGIKSNFDLTFEIIAQF